MQELEPTWGRVLSVWWLVAWRSLVGAMLIGAAVGFVFGVIAALANVPEAAIQVVSSILGLVVGLVWALVVVRMALQKRYAEFRIALVPVTAT